MGVGIAWYTKWLKSWLPAEGHVMSAKVIEDPSQFTSRPYSAAQMYHAKMLYDLELSYEYEVDGIKHSGKGRKSLLNEATVNKAIAQECADKYKTDAVIEIYYNPNKPSSSRSDTIPNNLQGHLYIIIGIALLVMGAVWGS